MAKSLLTDILHKAYRLAQLSSQKGMPPIDEIGEWFEYQKHLEISRKSFITGTLKAGMIMGATTILPKFLLPKRTDARIVVVGAGMAGLHAGYILQKQGLGDNLSIFEASGRTGGRIHTGKLNNNTGTTEFGGELVDSTHTDILNLAKEFGVLQLDRKSDPLISETFMIGGQPYQLKDAIQAFKPIRKKIGKDSLLKGNAFEQLDQMTLKSYFEQLDTDDWFRKVLSVAYTGECGLELDEQSAVNFVAMIGKQPKKAFEIFGESDERYKLLGGNQQLCDRMAEKLRDKLHLNHPLVAIQSKGKGFNLVFEGETREVFADYVIMTVPYTILRDVEGIDRLEGMTPKKLQCIKELGYGKNGKYFLETKDRPWRNQGYQGFLYSEKIHTGWDSFHMQNENKGKSIYTVYLGGEPAAQIAAGKGAELLPDLEKAFHGMQESFTGFTTQYNWSKHKYSKGSYACTKPGQITSITQYIKTPVGNMLFAGEHCSSSFGGFMNGAAETGRIAAEQLVKMIVH